MLYDIYNLKKSIIEYERNLRKLSVKRKRCSLEEIEISNFSILYASSEYIKSINSFVISYDLNLFNSELINEAKKFLEIKRLDLMNINIIGKISSKFLIEYIRKNLQNRILSYFYLNDYILPFKYSIRDFTILNIDNCEFLEGINVVNVKGNLIIRLDELLKELNKNNLLRISIHKKFLESFFIIKFKSKIPKLIIPKFFEGIDSYFRNNNFSFLLKKKQKIKYAKITKVSIKNNFIKIQFSEKMINKLLSLKNIFLKH